MSWLDFFGRSDANSPLGERRQADINHWIAPGAAIFGGWVPFGLYLTAYAIAQVVQIVREPTRAVRNDTIRDNAITFFGAAPVAMAAYATGWPLLEPWSLAASVSGLVVVNLFQGRDEWER